MSSKSLIMSDNNQKLIMLKLLLVIVTLFTVSAASVEKLESLSVQIGENISTQKCNQTLENIQVRLALQKTLVNLP